MKIGIITFHCAHNYGAMLQCVALQKALTKNGCDAEVIAYEPEYLTSGNTWYISPLQQVQKVRHIYASGGKLNRSIRVALSFSKAIVNDVFSIGRYRRYKKFEGFKESKMKLTEKYTDGKKLYVLKDRYDAVICGSDQIWNPDITDGKLDPAYFGAFAGKNTRVYGYAVSVCRNNGKEFFDSLKRLTFGMKMVSFRERPTYEALKQCVDVSVRTDIDPTLLTEQFDYAEYEEPFDVGQKYILLYTLDDVESKKRVIEKLRILGDENKTFCIIDISYSKSNILSKNKYKYIKNVSPGEFLTLFRNAEYVVTNSFHGTSFSIIYQKQFWSSLHMTRGIRIESLLNEIGLSDRILTAGNIADLSLVDYESVNRILSDMRYHSLDYLKSIINGRISVDE